MLATEPNASVAETVAYITCGNPFSRQEQQRLHEHRYHWQPEPLEARASQRAIIEPVAIVGHDGSELVVDEHQRILSLKDAAGRRFYFGYDKHTGEVDQVGNEFGTWYRQRDTDCQYSDTWLNTATGNSWRGYVQIGWHGYSYLTDNETVLYQPDGSKCTDYLINGQVFARCKEDKSGNHAVEDLRTNKITYRFVDGRSAIRNLDNNSLIGYDQLGRIAVLKDACGRRFEFSNYDAGNVPGTIVNESGRWDRDGDLTWRHAETGHLWSGFVLVDRRGTYSYSDLTGRTITRHLDGTSTVEYDGIRIVIDYDGNEIGQFTDA